IEKKVRMNLHLQCLQLCLRKLRRELAGASLAFTQSPVILDCMGHNYRGPVNRQPLMKVIDAECAVAIKREQRRIANEIRIAEVPGERHRGRQNHEREHNAQPEMKQQIAGEVLAEVETSRHSEYQRRKHPPDEEIGQVTR